MRKSPRNIPIPDTFLPDARPGRLDHGARHVLAVATIMQSAASPQRHVAFGAFRIDRLQGVLTRADIAVPLRPKAWELLLFFIDHAGELLSVDAILDAVWPGVAVSPKTLNNVIAELRHALSDDPEQPQYIATVHRRGYRFVGTVQANDRPPRTTIDAQSADPVGERIIGRTRELQQLGERWRQACAGERQFVFVTGEPGVGKTRLVDEFLKTRAVDTSGGEVWIGKGRCLERLGAHEAYMPVLEAIASLAVGDEEDAVREGLELYAPTWLAQIPWLMPPGSRGRADTLARDLGVARMLREGTQFLDSISALRPLILVLEDLHWADPETVDFLAALLRRGRQSRTLVIGTYRIAEARLQRHPIARVADDALRSGAVRIQLENLAPGELQSYLEQILAGGTVAPELTALVEEHSGGNPLFTRSVVDHLQASSQLRLDGNRWRLVDPGQRRIEIPESIRGMLTAQIQALPDFSRDLLGAAAVAGEEFDVGAVAAGLVIEPEQVEAEFESLASKSQFIGPNRLHPLGASADAGRCTFLHSLYQRVVYESLDAPRRRILHQRIGEHLERAGGDDLNPNVLAYHFSASRDHARAAKHLERCAIVAAERLADRERIRHLERALAHLEHIPESADRSALELRIHVGIGDAVSGLRGPHDARVKVAAERALMLCPQVSDPRSVFAAIQGLWLYNVMRSAFRANAALIEILAAIRATTQRPELRLLEEVLLGSDACFAGRPIEARVHLESAIALLDAIDEAWLPATIADPRVALNSVLGWNLWLLGFPDQALAQAERAVDRATSRQDINSTLLASIFLFNIHHLRGDLDAAGAVAHDLHLIGDEFEIEIATKTALLLDATLLIERRDIAAAFHIFGGLDTAGSEVGLQSAVRTYFLTRLALALADLGQPAQGLMMLGEASARIEFSGSPVSEAEVWRIRGDLAQQVDTRLLLDLGLVTGPNPDTGAYAEECLERALAITREQGARGFELRAATSLARLRQKQGRGEDAALLLRAVYDTYTEGLGTADVSQARALLEELRDDGVARAAR